MYEGLDCQVCGVVLCFLWEFFFEVVVLYVVLLDWLDLCQCDWVIDFFIVDGFVEVDGEWFFLFC